MSKVEYLENLNNCKRDEKRIAAVEKIYGTKLDVLVEKIVSYADKVDFFDDERRALSYAEIYNPKKNMQFDFLQLGLIPLVDAYDNTYVVYVIKEAMWAKYNTIDHVLFKKKKSLSEVL